MAKKNSWNFLFQFLKSLKYHKFCCSYGTSCLRIRSVIIIVIKQIKLPICVVQICLSLVPWLQAELDWTDFLFFTHAHKPKFGLFLLIYFDISVSLSSFPLPFLLAVLLPTLSSFFWMELWLANLFGKGKINLQRVVGKQRNWQWIFTEKVTLFCECNSIRIGQNIQNKVSLERSIFTDIIAHQFNLNWKLNGSRKESMHCSIWNENDQSSHRRVNCVCTKSEFRSPFLNPEHWSLI